MSTEPTDSELGRHLLTIRGFHFIFGAQGDPYALILRSESDDPVALGSQVRDSGELYRSEAGAWVTASHGLGAEILADPRLELRHAGVDGDQQQHVFQDVWSEPKLCHVLPLDAACLNLERFEYERLTRLSVPVLGDRAIGGLRSRAERAFARALDGVDGEFDLWSDVVRKAVVDTVAELLALPAERREEFARLTSGLGIALDAGLCPPQLPTARAMAASVEQLRQLLAEAVQERVGGTGDDLVSTLWRESGPMDPGPNELLSVATLLSVVGIDVTANLVCNGMSELLARPDQWALLRDDPELAAGAVAETLRYAPPIRLHNRIAREELELAGTSIPADSQVVVLVEAANRDPAVYPDPDRFDITRDMKSAPLTLAGGLYAGFVAPFVTEVAATGLRTLAARMPAVRQRDGVLRRMRSPVVQGLLRFPAAVA
ncbi:P450-derived glycosyltransferase activator [Micromonospora sp. NPDC049559]|uniref:cytochrome P450 family protein n=1 Tax=Micromonospora sp. NPDC049559 TaxID=3155923 RepID=UPI00342074E9